MNVEQVMTRDVKTCTIDSTLDDAARIMWDQDCGSVPVLDVDQRVVGMITDRDICMSAWSHGRPLVELRVASAMSARIHTCKPMDSLDSAEAIMRERQVRRLPVVGPDERLLGILSLNDIAVESGANAGQANAWITPLEVAQTLAAVCRSRHAADRALEPAAASPANGRARRSASLAATR